MASTNPKQPERIRLLLDQGFPKPPGFDPSDVDRNLEWIHLWDWNPSVRTRTHYKPAMAAKVVSSRSMLRPAGW